MSVQLGFFHSLLPLPHAFGRRELTVVSQRYVSSVQWQPESENTVNLVPGGRIWSSLGSCRPLSSSQLMGPFDKAGSLWGMRGKIGVIRDVSHCLLTCLVKLLSVTSLLFSRLELFPAVGACGREEEERKGRSRWGRRALGCFLSLLTLSLAVWW